MSKKFLSLISVLFLVGILSISCSNKDKTGDGTQTAQGIAKYAGTWDFKEDSSTGNESGTITIKEDGSVNFTIDQKPYTTKDVTDKENETYDVIFSSTDGTLTLTLKFSNDTTGSYEAKYSGTPSTTNTGTLTKQQQQ